MDTRESWLIGLHDIITKNYALSEWMDRAKKCYFKKWQADSDTLFADRPLPALFVSQHISSQPDDDMFIISRPLTYPQVIM